VLRLGLVGCGHRIIPFLLCENLISPDTQG
jgi:hypothetical protein